MNAVFMRRMGEILEGITAVNDLEVTDPLLQPYIGGELTVYVEGEVVGKIVVDDFVIYEQCES